MKTYVSKSCVSKTCAPFFLLAATLAAQVDPAYQVKSLRVEVLSTMLTSDNGIGEWGFSAVVEADGHRILFDTGARLVTCVRWLHSSSGTCRTEPISQTRDSLS